MPPYGEQPAQVEPPAAGRRARREDVPAREPVPMPPYGEQPPVEPPPAGRRARREDPPAREPGPMPAQVEPPGGRRARREDPPAGEPGLTPSPVEPPPAGRRARRDDAGPGVEATSYLAPARVEPPSGRRHVPEDPANRPPDVAARLGGAPPGPRPRPTAPPEADATRYTNAFSGSLPPPAAGARPPAPQRRPRPVEPPTEYIAPVADGYADDDYADEYEDYADEDYVDEYYEDEDYYDDEEPSPPPDSTARKAVRTVGELLITAGLVILLFVVYEVYVTDLISAGKQGDATEALDEQWSSNTVEADPQRQAQYELLDGQAFAKMYIPVFGPDYKFSIVEGTTDKDLEIGPGHYKGTALPGHPGNFSVAGHRVGKGAPFNDLDLLNPCDAIVVETQTEWIVYRMLPKTGDVAGWAEKQAANPKCAKVSPLGAPYDKTVGQEIVLPTQGEVIDVVPHFVGEPPAPAQQAALMTLTTCHPRFSDKQRLIVHAVLSDSYPKAPGFLPEEMKEQ